jgi:hypothetical protein
MAGQPFERGGILYRDNGDGTATVLGPANAGPIGGVDPSKQFDGRIAGNAAAASDYDPALARAELRVKEQQAATAAATEAREGAKFARDASKPIITDGQKKVDEKYATEYVDWTASGGYATVRRQLDQISAAMETLRNSDNVSGPVLGRMPKWVQQMVGPESTDVKADIEDVIQRSLRATLGAQFTQAEGDRMIERAFDPQVQEGSNLKRLERVITEIDSMAKAKESSAKYYESNGTLAGWSLSDNNYTDAVRNDGGKIITGEDAVDVGPYGRKESTGIVDNPELAGANEGVLRMLQQGADAGQIQQYLTTPKAQGGMGMDSGAVVPILGQIMKATEFYKKNPDYRGGHKINIDDMMQDTTAYNRTIGSFMDSRPGAAVTQGVNAVLPLDEFANLTGYDGKQMEAAKQYQRQEYPGYAIGGQVAGNIGGFIGTNKLVGPVVRQSGSLLEKLGMKKLGQYTAKSAPAVSDVAYSTVFGAVEDNENRGRGAGIGALSALAGGGAGKYIAAPAGRAIYSKFKPTPEKPGALAHLIGKIPDEVPQMRADLEDAQRLGLPLSLADTNPRLRSTAGSASRKSLEMRQMAEDVYNPRNLDQIDRLQNRIASDLTPPVDPTKLSGAIRKQAWDESTPFYEEAFAKPAPVNDELAALFENPTIKEGFNDAARIAANERRDPKTLGFDFDEAGDVIGVQNPSWRTLDLTKRGLDQKLKGFEVNGVLDLKGNPLAQSIEGLRRDYVKTLDNLPGSGPYKEARATFAKKVAPAESLVRGKDAFRPNIPPRDVATTLGKYSPEQTQTFGQGYATEMSDQANNVRDAANPYSRVYGGTSQKEKLQSIFPEGAADFERAYNLESQMAKTNYETIGGSPTQARNQADAIFDGGSEMMRNAGDVAGSALTGNPFPALMSGIRTFGRDAVNVGIGKAGQRRANEIGPVLMDTNPANNMAALEAMQRQLIERQQYMNKSNNIAGLFGRPMGGTAGLGYYNNQ